MEPDVPGYGPKQVSKIEFAKRIKAVRDVVSENQYRDILKLVLAPDQITEIEQAMRGLSEEDEFALMTRLMGSCSLLIPLQQNPILGTDYLVPDFLASFDVPKEEGAEGQLRQTAYTCLVEVKSTKKDSYRLSSGALARLRDVSARLGYPLVFAIRFVEFSDYAVWVIVEDDRKSETIRVDLTDFITGIRGELWNDYFYVLEQSIRIEFHYDPTFEESAIHAPDDGFLGRLLIHDGDRTFELEGSEAAIAAHVLRSFNLKHLRSWTQGTTTIQEVRPTNQFATVVDMLYNLNRIITDDSGNSIYDPPLILARADRSEEHLLERRDIEPVAASMEELGILSLLSYREFAARNGLAKDHDCDNAACTWAS